MQRRLTRGPRRAFGGMLVSELELPVPVDPSRPELGELVLFARLVEAEEAAEDERPYLVFLQGGPGFPSPRPETRTGWIGRALERFRVVLLDQRGTGRSAPATAQTLRGLDAAQQADWLACFRADAIVRDAELLREALGVERWTVLGQSYGGFCAVHYLSASPEGLAGALITGGLPPLEAHPDAIYRRTYRKVRERNAAYYERYPEDAARVRAVLEELAGREVLLPSGDRLSPRRFLTLGLHLGMSDGLEKLHYLVEQAFVETRRDGRRLGHGFLRAFEGAQSHDTNPIFSVLHEACYTQGFASRWSAARVLSEFPELDPAAEGPPPFAGEMIHPWMFEEIGALRGLRDAAHLLAEKEDWPVLYDADVLGSNRVPAAAAIYVDDMYVERGFAEETAAAIEGLSAWVTADHLHNGLRADGEAVLGELLSRLEG